MTEQKQRMGSDAGFIAALDQSGGSTPKALEIYGIDGTAYANEDEMFDLVHAMRTRIMTNPSFGGDRILGAILFQHTLDSDVAGQPTSEYLWREKRVLPILKIDYGLADEADGVEVMKPVPDLDERLPAARAKSVFGTKMRSRINSPNEAGIARVVEQQFAMADEIRGHGLVPIIEPEVNIHAEDKAVCEDILLDRMRDSLDKLAGDVPVMFKLTLPEAPNHFREFCTHPKVLRVVALSGGYSREISNQMLAANNGVIASFSRALTQGLHVDLDDAAFTAMLDTSIASIAQASAT